MHSRKTKRRLAGTANLAIIFRLALMCARPRIITIATPYTASVNVRYVNHHLFLITIGASISRMLGLHHVLLHADIHQ